MAKIIATEEEQKQRMEICKKCSNFTEKQFCGLCGCHMPLKVKGSFFKCPDGKW